MHNVAIYRIHAYQSPNHMPDHFKTVHHVNKHEIVFHNLEQYANILAHVLNRRVVYLERRIESLAVCMPHMDNKCADFYAKDLTLNAERQRLLCAWALTVMPECLKGRIVIKCVELSEINHKNIIVLCYMTFYAPKTHTLMYKSIDHKLQKVF